MSLLMLLRRACFAAITFACILPIAGWADSDALHVDLGDRFNLELVEIAAGTFVQGSMSDEPGHRPDELQREVRLTKKFYIGKYPVTRGQFSRFINETGYRTDAENGTSGAFGWNGGALVQRKEFDWRNPGFAQTDEDPVTTVTFGDSVAFLRWLSQKCGRDFVLPSEAEWEYACRAGTNTPWPNGADPVAADGIAWSKVNAGNGTRPVGQKAPNAWGLFDMVGNVWEWCEDWYGPYPAGPAVDPVQTNQSLSDKPRKVLRGGSWLRDRVDCRSPARYRNDPGSRNADNGFRAVTYAAPGPQAPPVQRERASSISSNRAGLAHARSHKAAGADGEFVEAGFGSLIFFGAIVWVVVVVARAIFRANPFTSPQPGGFSPGGRILTRIVDDGFWISGDLARGTPLLCRYDSGAGMEETQITFEPGPEGQFVFTGGRPANITVVPQTGGMQSPMTADPYPIIGNIAPFEPPFPVPVPPVPPYQGPPPAY